LSNHGVNVKVVSGGSYNLFVFANVGRCCDAEN